MTTDTALLNSIRIVLVSPTHPGNIGATARAMKTMGVRQLYLVTPKRFPDDQATERAAHSADILENACVVASLHEAIQDCTLVFALSARMRTLNWPQHEVDSAVHLALEEARIGTIAFVFGREHAGLTNEELELCHYQVHIPANPEYSSLNLAAAVQVICYELRKAWLRFQTSELKIEADWATMDEMERFYQHLEHTILVVNFLKPGLSGQVMSQLRRLFGRTRLERTEINILRGILTAVEKSVGSAAE